MGDRSDEVPTAATPPPAERLIDSGERVGRYEVRSLLGRGGMGAVYLAHDPSLDRPVAIKVLRGHDELYHRREPARLQREARALAQLAHPNVVAVYEVGSHEGAVFVAMEYVDGMTLSQWLREDERSYAEIVRVFVAAGRGLAAAHAAGIVHRDFKPANVLVAAPPDGRVRVADFGLAVPTGEEGESGLPYPPPALAGAVSSSGALPSQDVSLTETGMVMGTAAYMAPEQSRGQRASPAADQYAFCVALWEALFGTRPFGGAYLHQSKLAGPERPDHVSGPIRQAWPVLERGLDPDPARRWPSMEALLEVLDPTPDRASSRLPLIVGAVAIAIAIPATLLESSPDEPAAEPPPAAGEAAEPEPEKAAAVDELLELGKGFGMKNDHAAARKTFERAYHLALEADDPERALRAASHMVRILGATLESPHEAETWVRHADALLPRVPADSDARISLALSTGKLRLVLHDPHAAIEHFDRALELADQQVRGPVDTRATILRHRGSALWRMGRDEEALAVLSEAFELAVSIFGADALDVGVYHNELGGAYKSASQYELSHQHFARYAELVRTHLGDGDPLFVRASTNDALVLERLGRVDEALALLRTAAAATGRAKETVEHTGTMVNLGNVLRRNGRNEEAAAVYQRGIDDLAEHPDLDHPYGTLLRGGLGDVLVALGRNDEALDVYAAALEVIEERAGKEQPQWVRLRVGQGMALTAKGQHRKAREVLEAAYAMSETLGFHGPGRYAARELAYVLLKTGGDRARADALSATALEGYRAGNEELNVQQVEAWRAANGLQ